MVGDKIMGGDQLHAVWFAAGTAALIACVERAVVVSLFAHWRVWAFLALNLLLLAILFTSKPQEIPSDAIHQTDGDHDYSELERTKRRQEEPGPPVDGGESVKKMAARGDHPRVVCEGENGEEDGKREFVVEDQISNEELNKRAEAFITKFRQHLVSDGNKSFGKGITVTSCQGYSRRRVSFSHSSEYVTTV